MTPGHQDEARRDASERPRVPADTLARQQRASEPGSSAWVSANAGSGKTHVLAQRVVRLLLAGVPPARILCLTFTKAAAANMSIRVFRDLAAWTRLDDAALGRAIAETGAPQPGPGGLDAARRLFARTVETPGGLKIQTIHAFCERLLHLFPFEANVPARFEVVDDVRKADLLLRAREEVLADAIRDGGSTLGRAQAILAGTLAPGRFEALVAEALGHRDRLREARDRDLDALLREMRRGLGLRDDDTRERVEGEILAGGLPVGEWAALARRIGTEGSQTTGARLASAARAPEEARVEAYLDVFLTAKREPRAATWLPRPLRSREAALCEDLERERDRLVATLDRCRAAEAAERSAALLAVAAAILERYDEAKRRRGLLDFEDLVERTRNLLARAGSAWVLYKLDRGIDHILVDEAQDTSPDQWEILRRISEEFFAGQGSSERTRTFFAVGDEKQSIYAFQGADPAEFAKMHHHFERRARDAARRFAGVELILSFRSAAAVLRAVDTVFAHAANARGLGRDAAGPPTHQPLRAMPGRVEIWPVLRASPQAEPADWRLPVDVAEPGDPAVVVARRIADAVAAMTAPGSRERVEDNDTRRPRPVRPGDVLILVRSRNSVFEAMIRALKERGVPVAGADRLDLTQHIAVMDLVAAGRAALSPADDFTLACVLKSPLIGLDDDDLIALAPGRNGTLMAALGASDVPRHVAARARIEEWRRRAAWLTPFAFYTRLLGADAGRRELVGRLGPEAEDAIDEFLALTLAHERDGAPSLMAFLARLDGASVSIKRDMEAAGDAVRVMTVHAAKGLESKVVILPDTCGAPSGRHDPALFDLEGEAGPLVWSPRAEVDVPSVAAARAAVREAAREEHNRLLYVAMTRAEERLIVAGFCGDNDPAAGSWFAMIAAAGLPLAPEPAPWSGGSGGSGNPEDVIMVMRDPARASEEDACLDATSGSGDPRDADVGLPAWLGQPLHQEPEAEAPPVRPSNPLGAADQAGPPGWPYTDRRGARSRRDAATAGRLTHGLLQYLPDLPAERREAAAAHVLAHGGSTIEATRRAELATQALAVIADPALGPLFGPGSRAEVAVSARVTLPSGRTVDVLGQIDRIGVTPDAVFIADFKTGRPSDGAHARHALQLALYREAVAPLYPDRAIRTVLVWTAEAAVVELSQAQCRAALMLMG